MIDLTSISNKLKTSKMNVINHYKKIIKRNKNMVNHTKMRNHIRYFDDKLAKVITKSFHKSHGKGSNSNNKNVLQVTIKAQRELIKTLKQSTKDKNDEISRLQVDLQHQQELTRQSNQKLLTYTKHGFLWHLFH